MPRCDNCGYHFRTLPGEEVDHACPRCRWAPWHEAMADDQRDELTEGVESAGFIIRASYPRRRSIEFSVSPCASWSHAQLLDAIGTLLQRYGNAPYNLAIDATAYRIVFSLN